MTSIEPPGDERPVQGSPLSASARIATAHADGRIKTSAHRKTTDGMPAIVKPDRPVSSCGRRPAERPACRSSAVR